MSDTEHEGIRPEDLAPVRGVSPLEDGGLAIEATPQPLKVTEFDHTHTQHVHMPYTGEEDSTSE